MIQVPEHQIHNNTNPAKKAVARSAILKNVETREEHEKVIVENTLMVFTRTYTSSVKQEFDTNTTYVPLRGLNLQDGGMNSTVAGVLAPLDTEDVVLGSNTGGVLANEHLAPIFVDGHLSTLNRTFNHFIPGMVGIWGPAPRQADDSDACVRYSGEHKKVKRVTIFEVSKVTWNSIPQIQLAQALYFTDEFNAKAMAHDFTVWPYLAAIGAAGMVLNAADVAATVAAIAAGMARWCREQGYVLSKVGAVGPPTEAEVKDGRFRINLENAMNQSKLESRKLLSDEFTYWNTFIVEFTAGNNARKAQLCKKAWAVSCTVRESRLLFRITNQCPPGGQLVFMFCV